MFDRWHSRHVQIRHIRNLSCKNSLVQIRMRGWGHSCSTQAHTRTGTDTGPPALEALEIQGKKNTIESGNPTFNQVKK